MLNCHAFFVVKCVIFFTRLDTCLFKALWLTLVMFSKFLIIRRTWCLPSKIDILAESSGKQEFNTFSCAPFFKMRLLLL